MPECNHTHRKPPRLLLASPSGSLLATVYNNPPLSITAPAFVHQHRHDGGRCLIAVIPLLARAGISRARVADCP